MLDCILCKVTEIGRKCLILCALSVLFLLGSSGQILAEVPNLYRSTAVNYPPNYSPKFVDMAVIARIETGGERSPDTACSYLGCRYGRGRYQVSEITLKEFNQRTHAQLTPGDLFVPEVNLGVASWYLAVRIPEMLRYYGRPVSTELILVSYNAGIAYALKSPADWPGQTKEYLRKYTQLLGQV